MIKSFPIDFLKNRPNRFLLNDYKVFGGYVVEDFCCLVKEHVHCFLCHEAYQPWEWGYCCERCILIRPYGRLQKDIDAMAKAWREGRDS